MFKPLKKTNHLNGETFYALNLCYLIDVLKGPNGHRDGHQKNQNCGFLSSCDLPFPSTFDTIHPID